MSGGLVRAGEKVSARLRRGHGQADHDPGAAGGRTVDGDLAVVRLDQAFRGRQTKARAARFGGEERREDLLAHVGWNTRPGIDEGNLAGANPQSPPPRESAPFPASRARC